ncbi:MAG TPA: neutral zinc metallopeptidase [Nocardioides sp.]|nr:neutral zinc metallopeptidase [Nocardioides sp.]
MVRFNPKARLDTSRMTEAGGGGGGGGRMGGGGGLGGSGIGLPHIGGGLGVVVAIVWILIQVLGNGGGGGVVNTSLSSHGTTVKAAGGYSADYAQCKTGADANSSIPCALVAVENSLYDYWSQQPSLAQRLSAAGTRFKPENALVTFEGSVSTGGCGTATTDVGPFYCSGDGNIYLDEDFYTTVGQQLGIDPTGFVRAYVIAHEYGHHIQDLLGTINQVRTQKGPDSDSVRLELQADCYAGMWSNAASSTKDSAGVNIFDEISQQDISEAIKAAGEVGDDYIQKRVGNGVDQSQFTHGSSAQREAWFQAGYRDSSGDLGACDTFDASNLDDPGTAH